MRFGVVAAALVLGALPLANRTLAHHDVYFGSSYSNICDATPLSQCVANDANHFYALIELSPARLTATQRALGTLYGPNSDINVFTSNSSDLRVYEANNSVNAFAWGQCAVGATYGGSDAAHTRWCQPQQVFWQTASAAASKVNTTAKYNYIGCHEVGHTVGLRHRSGTPSTCMIPASKPPSDPTAVVPSIDYNATADYVRINDHY
ncbi:MAG: hypothetical protein HW391_1830 [Chloroflexi bacterium]|nr:hypothetical protein [Chloroflexota bacterium]